MSLAATYTHLSPSWFPVVVITNDYGTVWKIKQRKTSFWTTLLQFFLMSCRVESVWFELAQTENTITTKALPLYRGAQHRRHIAQFHCLRRQEWYDPALRSVQGYNPLLVLTDVAWCQHNRAVQTVHGFTSISGSSSLEGSIAACPSPDTISSFVLTYRLLDPNSWMWCQHNRVRKLFTIAPAYQVLLATSQALCPASLRTLHPPLVLTDM